MADWALVTGASRNIGRAIAARLKADGYRVVMLDRIEPEDPGLGEFRRVDLADPSSTAQALAWALDGRVITRAVNCAGVVALAPLEAVELAEFDRVMAVNVRSYIQVTQALLPAMRAARFGRVVNIASRAALGFPRQTSYSASKAAVVAMTKTWALEEAANGITVNAVGPGPIDTDMLREVHRPGTPERDAYVRSIPVGRIGAPDDIAHAVSYFLDARSGFVTGQVLFVCGGMTVGRANAS